MAGKRLTRAHRRRLAEAEQPLLFGPLKRNKRPESAKLHEAIVALRRLGVPVSRVSSGQALAGGMLRVPRQVMEYAAHAILCAVMKG